MAAGGWCGGLSVFSVWFSYNWDDSFGFWALLQGRREDVTVACSKFKVGSSLSEHAIPLLVGRSLGSAVAGSVFKVW
jgi:hypothetical protein